MSRERKAHRHNVPGAFYVVDGCCTACGVPEALAPDLFGWEDLHCFVKRQPLSGSEVDSMLRVVATQEQGCIRYCGDDQSILARLVEVEEGDQCDAALPSGATPLLRNHATFRSQTNSSAVTLLERLASYLQAARFKTTSVEIGEDGASLSVSWFEDHFHRIHCRRVAEGLWLIHHLGPRGLSDTLHDWLTTDLCAADLRWQTETQCAENGAWHHAPW